VSRYALNNHHPTAVDHHQHLAELLDPHTRRRIRDLPSWPHMSRVLEIGAGGGSISLWLADQLAPAGGVVTALDATPEHLPPHPSLRVVAHDLTREDTALDAVVGIGYDLIVARLTLLHLPNRERLVVELAGLLRVGGVLLVEDWAAPAPGEQLVVCAPSESDAELYRRWRRTVQRVFEQAGTDYGWARRAWRHLAETGLTDVGTRISGELWQGGHPGLLLHLSTAAQLRPQLLAAGMTEQQLQDLAELVDDPGLVVQGWLLWSTTGTRRVTGLPHR
jgi:SAM-dependent methyltransferase